MLIIDALDDVMVACSDLSVELSVGESAVSAKVIGCDMSAAR